MKKQTYLIMFALVAFFVAFAMNSCNTTNPAEGPNDNNSQDSTIVQNPNEGNDSKEETTLREVILPGLFSVNEEGKQIRFSQGNLQYRQSTDTWSFANQQYEILGEKNLTGATLNYGAINDPIWSGTGLADKIDLFGWSGSTGAAKWGVSTSQYDSDYSGDFVDWGKNPISNGGNKSNQWRTLTSDEWYYLRWKRRNYDELIGIAQVAGVNGLILLPDNFTLPAGLSFKSGFAYTESGFADIESVYAYAPYQSYTSAEWFRMESAGAVFLSASGQRSSAQLNAYGYIGQYWSATPDDEHGAYYLSFYSSFSNLDFDGRAFGLQVRLVQDVK